VKRDILIEELDPKHLFDWIDLNCKGFITEYDLN